MCSNTKPNEEENELLKSANNPFDFQIGGNHYQQFAIPPVRFITANNLGFCVGNIIKYVVRYPYKNGKEDLLKARHYIDLLIESEYPDNGN